MPRIERYSDLIQYIDKDPEEDLSLFSDESSYEMSIDDMTRIYNKIENHLTKEECLLFSLYKNPEDTCKNNIIKAKMHENTFGKKLSSSAMTQRKKRLKYVFIAILALLDFKQRTSIDIKLKKTLTKKQYEILMLYERRVPGKEICERISCLANWRDGAPNTRPLSFRFYNAVERLKKANDLELTQYLMYLSKVLKFSRKFPKHKRRFLTEG
jgi:hypothetical protein